ncbi:hypothetical protein Pan153_52730 [Gimesia panareensis]|uniref:DUF2029 domain-containing protein n=2 Tax=Gimesia panareensis TaxID=2527978 RepID=A0A518FW65_9PLAN|nr:hypothetical protein Pan153_52730 [Gimesia panareensis]
MSFVKYLPEGLSLTISGGILWLGCVAITLVSAQFKYGSDQLSRPIPLILAILAAMIAVYLLSLKIALNTKNPSGTWRTIWVYAVAMRCILLFSTPILEIDYYRYMWDGETVLAGVSPYRYSPEQVILAEEQNLDQLPAELALLSQVSKHNKTATTILRRIHFAELPSIYPPVSQMVFALSALSTPDTASVETAILFLKFWIVCFDLGTIFLLWKLLIHLNLHPGWTIAYAWCPLILKEFANSGHLDAIAVFFTVLGVFWLVKALYPSESVISLVKHRRTGRTLNLAGLSLGLAIGAKLFPAVLIPFFLATVWKKYSLSAAVRFAFLTGIVSLVACWPQISPRLSPSTEPAISLRSKELSQLPQESLGVFLTRWKMNDFIFRLIEENLTPARSDLESGWVTITPVRWRDNFVNMVSQQFQLQKELVPFLTARFFLSFLTLVLILYWSWQGAHTKDPREWLHFVFLTLAWFWVCLPTLNPWYWTWVVPFLPFAKRRSWFLVSGLLFLYYSRFWFDYQWKNQEVWNSGYLGEEYFHQVVVGIEHLIWMLALILETFITKTVAVCSASQKDNSLSA